MDLAKIFAKQNYLYDTLYIHNTLKWKQDMRNSIYYDSHIIHQLKQIQVSFAANY